MIIPFEYPVTLVMTNKADKREIYRQETTGELLRAAVTTASFMFNALTMSGGTRWVNPTTGEHYPAGIGWHVELIHPDTGELVEAVPS